MSVHELSKYPEIRRLLDIPEDEPIFILRAQDMAAAATIEAYRLLYSVAAETAGVAVANRRHFSDHLRACVTEFHRFEVRHPSAMKIPD